MFRAAGLLGATTLWDPIYQAVDPKRIRKALDPNSLRDYLVLIEREARKLAGKSKTVLDSFYSRVFDRLDEAWTRLPAVHREAVLRRVLADTLAGFPTQELSTAVTDIAASSSRNIIKRSASTFQSMHDLPKAFRWTGAEDEVAAWLGESAGNYVTTINSKVHGGASKLARDIVRRGVKEGLAHEFIADELQDALGDYIGRTNTNYWRTVASSYVSRARSYGHISSMNKAAITEYQIIAVIDNVTCPRCRFLHQKTFTVGGALGIFDKLKALKKPEDIKYAHPWPRIKYLPEGLHEIGIPTKKGIVPIARETRSGMGITGDVGDWETLPGVTNRAATNLFPPFHGG